MSNDRKAVLVVRPSRLDELIQRFNTEAQARFYIEHLGGDFEDYRREHLTYVDARRLVESQLRACVRVQILERRYLPTYLFAPDDIVVALGQDGLVANTMKYLSGQALVGVNPEPQRYDGVLLPFAPMDVLAVIRDVLSDRRGARSVTMAKATLSDAQTMYAVNDLFIGPRSHTSAHYEIVSGGTSEVQSSSGLIVSTGLGSTAWMKSLVVGACSTARLLGGVRVKARYQPVPWDAPYLQFAVREPFPSVSTQCELVCGRATAEQPLMIRSRMAEHGVIFSDGIESDFVAFNSGVTAIVTVAERRGQLIQ